MTMKIAVTINAHNNTPLVLDTIESVKRYVTEDILMIYDRAAVEWGSTVKVPVCKLQGLIHGYHRAPYRNLTLGLWETTKLFPDADWYCYMEPDVLFASSSFKDDLEVDDTWCVANDYRHNKDYYEKITFPLLEKIIKGELGEVYSVLGCCVFYHKDLFSKLEEIDFYDKFLWYTNVFQNGFFPSKNSRYVYDFGEYLYPTLISYFGKKTRQLARWDEHFRMWRGNFRKYPMRFKPQLDPVKEDYPESAILHPIKDVDHPIREMKRMQRYANR